MVNFQLKMFFSLLKYKVSACFWWEVPFSTNKASTVFKFEKLILPKILGDPQKRYTFFVRSNRGPNVNKQNVKMRPETECKSELNSQSKVQNAWKRKISEIGHPLFKNSGDLCCRKTVV